MQTNKIKIDSSGQGREQVLEETAKFAVYNNLDKKTALHIRLLAEETLGMVTAITEKFDAEFWLETTPDNICQLHLLAHTFMDYEKEKQLIAASSKGKNEAVKGFMGRIGQFIKNALYSVDEMDSLSMQYAYDPMLYGATGMLDAESMAINSMIYSWSMQQYQEELEQNKEGNQQAEEAWDELEKSIVASIADDVRVGVKGDTVELIIEKKL